MCPTVQTTVVHPINLPVTFGISRKLVEGVAKNLATSSLNSLKGDAYALIFGAPGLMAGVSIEGTKISRIKR